MFGEKEILNSLKMIKLIILKIFNIYIYIYIVFNHKYTLDLIYFNQAYNQPALNIIKSS